MKERRSVFFDLNSFHEFANCNKFERLYNEWKSSNYSKQKKPSIDRINNKKGYTIDNIQWLTWAENRYKQSMERRNRKGAVVQLLDGEVVKEFKSQRDAVRALGLSQSYMSKVLNGKGDTCGGYQWKYKNPELIK